MAGTNLVIVGGFLGAGKTTSILSIAKYLLGNGKKIGIVTNDQGSDLVDTNFLAKEGLPVLEVTGGCFCCNFDEFTAKVNELAKSEMPDVILAEPVGSCTDLIATIFKPIMHNYINQFVLRPLSIVADPKRVKKLMMEKEGSLFPNEINYLFRKQMEEADIIVLNKADTLTEEEIRKITSFLKEEFKGTDVLAVSAKNGTGIQEWIQVVMGREAMPGRSLDIDYDTYALAEEYLGWLNSTALLKAGKPINVNSLVESLMDEIKAKLKDMNREIAHLKIYGVAQDEWVKASITSIHDEIDFNKTMEKEAAEFNLIINARVNTDPETLRPLVETVLADVCSKADVKVEHLKTECFKPGRPMPKYRMG
ncbi:MAG TPA: cobalamin biosynthesis protein P47K [Clostridiaceae bacterium]|nr:cobalamin biosynthesis protein P47K [Clostridiaceae bacterium]